MAYANSIKLEEPILPAAIWCWRGAFFSFCLAVIGLLAARRGVEPGAILIILIAAFFLGAIALTFGISAMGTIWRRGSPGGFYLISGILLATSLLSFPIYLAAQIIHRPPSSDLSTSANDPPSFSLSRPSMLARGFQTPATLAQSLRKLQHEAYPSLQPLRLALPGPEAFAMVQKAATESGWRIIEAHAPGGRMGLGHIDAIARSPLFHFENDIAIRLRPLGDETLVDLRLASRQSNADFFQNAQILADFIESLQSEADKSE